MTETGKKKKRRKEKSLKEMMRKERKKKTGELLAGRYGGQRLLSRHIALCFGIFRCCRAAALIDARRQNSGPLLLSIFRELGCTASGGKYRLHSILVHFLHEFRHDHMYARVFINTCNKFESRGLNSGCV